MSKLSQKSLDKAHKLKEQIISILSEPIDEFDCNATFIALGEMFIVCCLTLKMPKEKILESVNFFYEKSQKKKEI